jgi:lipoprotein-anchoring transpeptidase ErfK/SrfK
MSMDIWVMISKRVIRKGSAQRLRLWLAGALLIIFLAGSAGVAAQQPVRALSSAQPKQASSASLPPSPTPSLPPVSPTPPSLPPADLQGLQTLPPGLSGQQPQILAELGHPSKALLVSIAYQTLYAYEGNRLVVWSSVTTGRPELQTPRGFYRVLQREQSVMFYSKWPPSSPYYYAPVFVHYALRFLGTDFFLHDYSPRHYYGSGTNVWHQNPDGTWETGSHGCVEAPLAFMRWLYDWASLGTPIVVY